MSRARYARPARLAPMLAAAALVSVAAPRAGVAQPPSAGLGPGEPAPALERHRRFVAGVDSVLAPMNRSDGPGCAVGVSREGRTLFARGYGMSDVERGVAITPGTVFDVGSITKQFTARAVLLLAAEGRLALDDHVRRHVPELPPAHDAVTLRHLLSHTSGLPDYLAALFRSGRTDAAFVTQDTVLRVIASLRALRFEPGAAWEYSNSGYVLLAEAVRRAGGRPYGELVGERVLRPLGMSSSVVMDDYTMLIAGRASGYQPKPYGGFARVDSHHQQVGDGGLFTSVADLARWQAHLWGAGAGAAGVGDTMRRAARTSDGRAVGYGMGLVAGVVDGDSAVWHGGGGGGFASELLAIPRRRLSVAVLCNVGGAPAALYARAVAGLALAALAEAGR